MSETAPDYVFVTDYQEAMDVPGCQALSVVDARSGRSVVSSEPLYSVGRIAITSRGDLGVAVANINRGLVLLERDSAWAPPRWASRVVPTSRFDGQALEISPDDLWLLLGRPGAQIDKYRLEGIRDGTLGSPDASASGAEAAEIVFTADSRTAYVVTPDGELMTLDVATMTYAGSAVRVQAVATGPVRRIRNTFATLSPDGAFLVINTGRPQVNVVDVGAGRAWLVDTPGLQTTMGVAFDYVHPIPPRLAVHGHTAVAVYAFWADRVDLVASASVPAQVPLPEDVYFERLGTLAWLGRGDGIAAAIGGGNKEYRVLDFDPAAGLTKRLDFDGCTMRYAPTGAREIDVATVNRIGIVPEPTPTVTATVGRPASPSATGTSTTTSTSTPSPSATVTATPTATTSPTQTPTAIACATPTTTPTPTPPPTATPVPARLFLPLALRERCPIDKQHVDVALVIDVSTSMRDDRTATGRTKLETAVEAAGVFVGALALPLDHAAVVGFNSAAWVEQPLTARRADVDAALARIPQRVREQTRIDLGIEEAHRELLGPRRLAGNRPVMIVLTDGLANPEPASTAVRRAAEAKAADITIFTIGLGDEGALNVPELTQMATRPDYFYHAPDAEDLATIYRAIAVELPCPGVRL